MPYATTVALKRGGGLGPSRGSGGAHSRQFQLYSGWWDRLPTFHQVSPAQAVADSRVGKKLTRGHHWSTDDVIPLAVGDEHSEVGRFHLAVFDLELHAGARLALSG